MMAVWRLGGIVSCGDSALKADTIHYQVSQNNGLTLALMYEEYYVSVEGNPG